MVYNEDMGRKTLIVALSVVLLVGILMLGFRLMDKSSNQDNDTSEKSLELEGAGKSLSSVEGGSREPIKEVIVTPEKESKGVPSGVAVPQDVIRREEDGGKALRNFSIKGENNTYVPNTIVVNDGDVINISFTAVEKKYNIFFPDFGIYKTVEKGQTQTVNFQATPYGQYTFFCKDVCSEEVEGILIVNKK